MEIRALAREEIERIWTIDHSEFVDQIYRMEEGMLVPHPHHFHIRGWPPGEAEQYTPKCGSRPRVTSRGPGALIICRQATHRPGPPCPDAVPRLPTEAGFFAGTATRPSRRCAQESLGPRLESPARVQPEGVKRPCISQRSGLNGR